MAKFTTIEATKPEVPAVRTPDPDKPPAEATKVETEATHPIKAPGLRAGHTTLRAFEAQGKKGRDGTGPCRVREGRTVLMPCGVPARAGDTFDPVEENFDRQHYLWLQGNGFIVGPAELASKLEDRTGMRQKLTPPAGKLRQS